MSDSTATATVPPPAAPVAAVVWLRAAALPMVAAAMLAAAAWRIRASLGHMMWLDELYTATLIGSPSLGHLWEGAVRGVDGNPPLYMSIAWMLAGGGDAAPEAVLRPFNLVLLAATAALLYRLGRRVASPVSVAAVLSVLPAIVGSVDYALLEVRTYALYLFLVTAVLSGTLRVVDRPAPGRAALLAGVGVLATLAHSFGGFYTLATLGSAGLVCLADRDRRAAATLALAAVPAAAALAGWIALSLPYQMAVATPYGWIPQPDAAALAKALTGSLSLTPVLAVGLLAAVLRRVSGPPHAPWRRDVAALYAALAGYAGLTIAGWAGSQVITPFFVWRYFIPDLLVTVLILVPVAESVRRRVGPEAAAAALALCVLFGLSDLVRERTGSAVPCLDGAGRFLEEADGPAGLPVVTESPHAWLPRSRYAPGQTTLYPLDWRFVLDRPDRATNNAMDFHIMEILRGWAPPGSALATGVVAEDDLVARHRHFLLLDEDARGWLDELRSRLPVATTLIREGESCRLLDVRLGPAPGTPPRP